jgi:hypothetical protein
MSYTTDSGQTDNKSVVGFKIPFSVEEFEDLKAWAKEHGVPLSHLCRKVILDAVVT